MNADGDLAGWSIMHPGLFVRTFPIEDLTGHARGSRTPSYYSLSEIGRIEIARLQKIDRMQDEMAADAGTAMSWATWTTYRRATGSPASTTCSIKSGRFTGSTPSRTAVGPMVSVAWDSY